MYVTIRGTVRRQTPDFGGCRLRPVADRRLRGRRLGGQLYQNISLSSHHLTTHHWDAQTLENPHLTSRDNALAIVHEYTASDRSGSICLRSRQRCGRTPAIRRGPERWGLAGLFMTSITSVSERRAARRPRSIHPAGVEMLPEPRLSRRRAAGDTRSRGLYGSPA